MKCLRKYKWVKLMRSRLPEGKGIMAAWTHLASHAAFRKGYGLYCGHRNPVTPGMWTGGIVDFKSILGTRTRTEALEVLAQLERLEYIEYSLDLHSKKLTYRITDWEVTYSGSECPTGTVYPVNEYGFLCMPRNITERLVNQNYIKTGRFSGGL